MHMTLDIDDVDGRGIKLLDTVKGEHSWLIVTGLYVSVQYPANSSPAENSKPCWTWLLLSPSYVSTYHRFYLGLRICICHFFSIPMERYVN